jgi:hypothetical protein
MPAAYCIFSKLGLYVTDKEQLNKKLVLKIRASSNQFVLSQPLISIKFVTKLVLN